MEVFVSDQYSKKIQVQISALAKRLQRISDEEARSASTGGLAAQGHFQAERGQIINRTDELLTVWEELIRRNAR